MRITINGMEIEMDGLFDVVETMFVTADDIRVNLGLPPTATYVLFTEPPPPPSPVDSRTREQKLVELAERGSTPGERDAARLALERLRAKEAS